MCYVCLWDWARTPGTTGQDCCDLIPNATKVSGCKCTEIGVSCPSLFLEVEQEKLDGKIKSYVFPIQRRNSLQKFQFMLEYPDSFKKSVSNTCKDIFAYLQICLLKSILFMGDATCSPNIFVMKNKILFSHQKPHILFEKFYIVRHFIHFSIEITNFTY